MKIRYLSDLHLEWRDNPFKVTRDLPPGGDALVIAGDTVGAWRMGQGQDDFYKFLYSNLAEKAPHLIVVPGNHEYYGTRHRDLGVQLYDPDKVDEKMLKLGDQLGFHYLNNRSVTLDGVTFYGGTGWYSRQGPGVRDAERTLSDGRHIWNRDAFVAKSHDAFEAGLKGIDKDRLVVVSHHLPSAQIVPSQFIGSVTNPAFLLTDERGVAYLDRGPSKAKAWICGHTHSAKGAEVNGTKIYCNPAGYPHERSGWNPIAAFEG